MTIVVHRKIWIWSAILLLAIIALASVVLIKALGPQVVAVPVVRREIVQTLIVSGRVLPPARINVGSMLAGVVTAVLVREGDHVQPGQLLVKLEDAEAQAAVLLAKAGLKQARARLRQLKHITGPVARELHIQADANLELARLNYERLLTLVKRDSAPAAQLDEAKRALDIAKSQHDATSAQAQGSSENGAEHALAIAAYAQAAAAVAQAEAHADEARITAATSAVVLTRSVEPGELTQPGRILLMLARDGQTLLSVQPDEKNLAELRLGQSARASADAFFDQHFEAEVVYIAPSIDPQRGTVEVRFAVKAPPTYLRPDMTVSVNIEVGRREAALAISKNAVSDLAAGKPWVFVLKDRRIEKRSVQVGLHDDRLIEIRQGLADGEKVILPTGAALKSGQRVRAAMRTEG